MDIARQTYAVGAAASIIAGVCIVAAASIAIRDRARTGQYPQAIRGGLGRTGWFGMAWWCWWAVGFNMKDGAIRTFPLYVLVPGIDLALGLAFLAFAGFAFASAFRAEWDLRVGLRITYSLLFPALMMPLVYRDVKCLESMPWAWILAGIVGLGLAPFVARCVYQEYGVER